MDDKPLGCERCGREIPAKPLWTALAKRARLKCSGCGHQVVQDYLLKQGEGNALTKALLLTYGQLVQFGSVSYGSLTNAGVEANPQMIGGLLTGLTRAGLIRRGSEDSTDPVVLSDPKPVFVPGPNFPFAEEPSTT